MYNPNFRTAESHGEGHVHGSYSASKFQMTRQGVVARKSR